jgi:FlaG/FlaF family flagellin (archaellin)
VADPRASRASVPVVGVVLLLAVTTVLAGVVAVGVVDLASEQRPPSARLTVTADAGTDRITVHHEGGDPLDVGAARLVVSVDGERLAHQPPVPFFAARGFRGGPTGAFNLAGSTTMRAGDSAGIRLASTNDPSLSAGATVTVAVYVDGHLVAETSTTAR